MTVRGTLYTDGGSRGNPGPAGIGIVLLRESGDICCSGGRYLGECTNNIAEYQALIWGLQTALACDVTDLVVRCDSELIVKQMRGEYRVKNAGLQPLHARAKEAARALSSVRYEHVPREQNKRADALANAAMDARRDVGDVSVAGSARDQRTLF
ncbi:MAG: ribonuclease HI family protein [Actinomycetia bacterium]|nr:ribonuclease HI family protein [Actinomycetes bacterium]